MMRLLPLLAALLSSTPARAGVESVGTTSANFLKIPAHARPAAMGEAYTAISDDEAFLLYNPAGAARALRHQLSATHIEWFQGIRLEHLGGLVGLGPLGSIGASLSWLQVDELTRTERTGNSPDPLANYKETGKFSPHDMAFTGAWAFTAGRQLNGGLGLKLLQQDIDGKQGWAGSLDLGAQYTRVFGWLDLGLILQNLGNAVAVGPTAFQQPLTFRGGAAAAFYSRRLLFSLDAAMPMDNDIIPALGVEGWLAGVLALRAGWRGGYASQLTAGLGLLVAGFQVDYAWQPYQELGSTHRVTASYSFGQPSIDLGVDRPLMGPVGEAAWREAGWLPKVPRPDAARKWKLRVYSPGGSLVREMEGAAGAPERVAWDGRDKDGHPLPDGLASARLSVDYGTGIEVESGRASVELDSTPPQLSFDITPKVVRPNEAGAVLIPATLSLQASDKHGVGGWKLEITNKEGKPFRMVSADGPPPPSIVWDGTDGRGTYVDSGKTYIAQFFAKDRLGNWAKTPPQAQIVLMKELHFDIASDALFEPGKADVRISAYQQLKEVKDLILTHHQEGTVVDIIGHTDNEPTVHSVYASNQELSLARAKAVVKFLVTLLSMDPQILNAVGKGDSKPKADNATAEGRESNRRVEVVIHAKEYR